MLEGGYRAFRRAVLAELETLPAGLDLRVVCGRTGSAKSRLLNALRKAGAQVLDLEALACHRGSVLGLVPGFPQPTQKAFETALWQALRSFDPQQPVYAEGESRTIGRLRVPERLLEKLRAAHCLHVEMPLESRVAFLLDDYAHFVRDTPAFCERLALLRELRGAAVVGGVVVVDAEAPADDDKPDTDEDAKQLFAAWLDKPPPPPAASPLCSFKLFKTLLL